jgi:cyclin A
MQVEREKLQLVAATCLHVASKCEDTAYISVNDLVMCADNLYTAQEVLLMEEKLLNSLKFRLAVPNGERLSSDYPKLSSSSPPPLAALIGVVVRAVYDFLKIFQEMMPDRPLNQTTKWLAEYLAELSLQEYEFLKFLPSLVATCCISLALYALEEPHWVRLRRHNPQKLLPPSC